MSLPFHYEAIAPEVAQHIPLPYTGWPDGAYLQFLGLVHPADASLRPKSLDTFSNTFPPGHLQTREVSEFISTTPAADAEVEGFDSRLLPGFAAANVALRHACQADFVPHGTDTITRAVIDNLPDELRPAQLARFRAAAQEGQRHIRMYRYAELPPELTEEGITIVHTLNEGTWVFQEYCSLRRRADGRIETDNFRPMRFWGPDSEEARRLIALVHGITENALPAEASAGLFPAE